MRATCQPPGRSEFPAGFSLLSTMADTDEPATFASFANVLDARILRALADLNFARPTLVQAKAIPLALEGRDILARARTGSGKTAAYSIPVVQKILSTNAVRFENILVQWTLGLTAGLCSRSSGNRQNARLAH